MMNLQANRIPEWMSVQCKKYHDMPDACHEMYWAIYFVNPCVLHVLLLLTWKGHSFKQKSIVIRVNRHTITRTEFQVCNGTFINKFSIVFDNHEYVCAASLAFLNFQYCLWAVSKQIHTFNIVFSTFISAIHCDSSFPLGITWFHPWI